MNIQGKLVTLRAVEQRDIDTLHYWSTLPELQHIMGNIYFPTNHEWHEKWFDRISGDDYNKHFAIEVIGEKITLGLLGLTTLVNIDWRNRRAYHGIMLGNKDIRGKGYGKDAVMATMRYAFDELGFERLDGGFIEYNTGSVEFYKKMGWEIEGIKKNYYFHQGKWHNHLVAGITKEQYQTVKNYWDE